MKGYEITFTGWRDPHPGADEAEFGVVRVRIGDLSFPVSIRMTDTLGFALGYRRGVDDKTRARYRAAMLLVALPRIRDWLDGTAAPDASTDTFLWSASFSSDQREELDSALGVKQCEYQVSTKRGLKCDAGSEEDKLSGQTSRAVCLGCALPDDRVRCSNLLHPAIMGTHSVGGQSRQPHRAFCDIKTENFDASLCRPGGHDCWRQRFDAVEVPPEIPLDIGERTIEELAFLNLTFKNEVGRALLRINDPRSTPGLLLGCRSSEDFAFRMATVADIINNFDPGEVADPAGKKLEGQLNRLQALLSQRGVLLDEAPIRRLRDLVTIRNGLTHTGNSKVVAAFAGLGMEYPPTLWSDSWQQALFHFWTALRAIRQMITTSPPTQENGAGTRT